MVVGSPTVAGSTTGCVPVVGASTVGTTTRFGLGGLAAFTAIPFSPAAGPSTPMAWCPGFDMVPKEYQTTRTNGERRGEVRFRLH